MLMRAATAVQVLQDFLKSFIACFILLVIAPQIVNNSLQGVRRMLLVLSWPRGTVKEL